MTRPGIEPQSPGPLANTVLIRPTVIPDKRKKLEIIHSIAMCLFRLKDF